MNQSVDQNRYIPWVSFPAIYFLDRLKLNDVSILEFGGGASTIYFAQKCRKVLCIEFSKSWHEVLEKTLVDYKNTRLVYANAINEQSSEYSIERGLLLQAYSHDTLNFDLKELPNTIENFIKFTYQEIKETDLVFIDGGYRNLNIIIAAYASNNSLGIIVDNVDFSTTSFGVKKLKELGYIEIPFHGLSPLNAYSSTTSIFSKEPNKILTLLS
jgi:predicted O-methyltransferase YrrM